MLNSILVPGCPCLNLKNRLVEEVYTKFCMQDSEELLRNLHLAPYAKPIVSLVDDFPMVQRHKGWQFGYLASNATRRMTCALHSQPLAQHNTRQ